MSRESRAQQRYNRRWWAKQQARHSNRTVTIFLCLVVIAALVLLSGCTTDSTLDMEHGYPDDLIIYKDGSALSPSQDRSWEAGTFAWDCATMGNRRCGVS